MDNFQEKFFKTFKGECFGIGLYEDDGYILFKVIVEDDGNWFESTNGGSGYWLEDLMEEMSAAQRYLALECIRDDGGFKRKQ